MVHKLKGVVTPQKYTLLAELKLKMSVQFSIWALPCTFYIYGPYWSVLAKKNRTDFWKDIVVAELSIIQQIC